MSQPSAAEGFDRPAWHARCARRMNEIEPRLDEADCVELAATLWQLDDYQRMPPQAAAERFLADNPCAEDQAQTPWWNSAV
jgi:hypothetical protein